MFPLAIFGLGVPELLIILAVVLLLFGGSRLAGLGKSTGRALKEFKEETKGLKGDEKAEQAGVVGPTTAETPATPQIVAQPTYEQPPTYQQPQVHQQPPAPQQTPQQAPVYQQPPVQNADGTESRKDV